MISPRACRANLDAIGRYADLKLAQAPWQLPKEGESTTSDNDGMILRGGAFCRMDRDRERKRVFLPSFWACKAAGTYLSPEFLGRGPDKDRPLVRDWSNLALIMPDAGFGKTPRPGRNGWRVAFAESDGQRRFAAGRVANYAETAHGGFRGRKRSVIDCAPKQPSVWEPSLKRLTVKKWRHAGAIFISAARAGRPARSSE